MGPNSGRHESVGIRRAIAGASGFDLALRLTLLDLLLRPIGDSTLRPIVLGLAGAGLVLPGMARAPSLWGLLTLATALRVLFDYPLPDNHAYLLCYWCLAISLALRLDDAYLVRTARMLIGLVFAFAVVWKLALSPDFIDGTFFRVTLLTDPRFGDLSRLVGGLSAETLASHREILLQHADAGAALLAPLPEPAPLRLLARGLTAWTLAIEGVLAAVFLWPGIRGPAQFRDGALLLFCATTFAVATVEGFGWLLLAIGIAQCQVSRTRMLYLATYALILGYREVPWLAFLAERIQPA